MDIFTVSPLDFNSSVSLSRILAENIYKKVQPTLATLSLAYALQVSEKINVLNVKKMFKKMFNMLNTNMWNLIFSL